MADKKRVKTRRYFDYLLLFIVLFLLGFGLVMIYSTSFYAASTQYGGDGLYFFRKQAVAVVLGLAVMFVVSFVPVDVYRRLTVIIYIVSFVSVLLVLSSLAHSSHGATRWIYIFGFSIQPAEIAKIGAIITTATIIFGLKKKERLSAKGFFMILLPGAVLAGLVLVLTKNLSSAIIIGGIVYAMYTLCEKKNLTPYIILLAGIILAAVAVLLIIKFPDKFSLGYRAERILAWVNPEAYADGKGFQPIQSLYGIGSGGIWGKGLGKSVQKLYFLPEAHNDMIFSIICEELGLFGGLAIIIMFILLLWRIRDISAHITDVYENLLLTGIFAQIAIQVLLNIAVVTNTVPNTGISLPFISYGGSSVIILLAEMGIVMRISRDCDFREEIRRPAPAPEPEREEEEELTPAERARAARAARARRAKEKTR
ncbi:MAG: FtsW/RodA/SpoVE family cell cycle protein [Lachnospiraceae bacterium]|nr:FtsW/RodA/SpoVE family cell cycle protein [Lachnospiraceae bacterium]